MLVSADYVKPLRCGFRILDRQEDNEYYDYNPFASNNDLNVQSINLNLSEGGHGTASIRLFDEGPPDSAFDIKNGMIRGSVIFQVGKTEAQMSNILYAYNPKLDTDRPATNQMYRTIQCEGKVTMLDERLVNFVRHAAYKTINDSTFFVRKDKLQAYKLVNELFTKEKIMPLGSYQNSIQEHGNYLLTGISNKVTDFIAALDMEFASARAVLDAIAAFAGAIWRIDQNNNVIFEYPREQHTGILIRPAACDPSDQPFHAFPIGGWSWSDSAHASNNFATNLIGKTNNPLDLADSESATSNQREKLFEQDLAQQFPITTQDFSELVLLLKKEGEPESDLHFHIVEDNANTPTGKKIAEGTIDIDSIPEDEIIPVYISKIRFKKRPKVGTNAWIILYRVEGEDDDNTLAWYHDDGSTSTSAVRDVVLSEEDAEDDETIDLKHPNHTLNTDWVVTVATGKKFAYSIFDFATYLTIAYDPRAVDKFGWVDKFVDLSFTSHIQTAMLIMHAFLAESATVLRSFNFPAVTIPDPPWAFYPEQQVTVHDPMSGFTPQKNVTFKVTNVGYNFSPFEGLGAPYGARTCSVSGVTRVDHMFDDVNDDSW